VFLLNTAKVIYNPADRIFMATEVKNKDAMFEFLLFVTNEYYNSIDLERMLYMLNVRKPWAKYISEQRFKDLPRVIEDLRSKDADIFYDLVELEHITQ
jgi:hypothetical protein